MNRRGWLGVALGATLLGGCATRPPALEPTGGMEIRGLVIHNRSFGTLGQVTLRVVQTGEFISCGNIPMRGNCATRFPLRRYQGNDIEIRWREGGRDWSTGDFRIELTPGMDPEIPAWVRVIITPAGTALTDLVQ